MMSVHPLRTDSPPGSSTSGSSSFVWKYCRMCAKEVKQGVYIFGDEGRRLHIPEKIRKTVAILVLEEDNLPKRICTRCCTNLEAYTQFKDAVSDAQDKLSQIARSIEKSQEQNLFQIRSQNFLGNGRSPKRQRFYHSPPAAHSHPGNPSHSSLNLLPLPAPPHVLPDIELEDPVECDDIDDNDDQPSSPISSVDEDFEKESAPNKLDLQQESSCSVEELSNSKGDDLVQEQVQQQSTSGLSPNLPSASSVNVNVTGSKPVLASLQVQEEECPPESLRASDSEDDQVNGVENDDEIEDAHLICGLCTSSMKDKDSLIGHHSKHHSGGGDPKFGCSECPRISPNYDAIRQHIYRHRKAGTFKCPDCEKSYPTKDQLHVHISSKHNPSSDKPFSCCNCDKKFTTNIALSAHQKKKHAPNSTITSRSEVSTTTTIVTVIEAASSSSSSLPTSPEVKRIQVPSPAKINAVRRLEFQQNQNESGASKIPVDINSDGSSSSSTKINLDHADIDSKSKPEEGTSNSNKEEGFWKCDFCEKILQSKHGYETHIATHRGRRFTCDDCGATYTQKSTLEHHVKVHHTNMGKEFECPVKDCEKRFKTLRQLGWHKKIHENPLTDIKCPQCEKKFLNLISLKTHMKFHRGSKKFPCAECPKSFYTKLKLEEHMNSHTGRRPFGCPADKCSKHFSCFSNYAKHFKKHHSELVGPKGRLVPQPKMLENNNNEIISTPSSKSPSKIQNQHTSVIQSSSSTDTPQQVVQNHHDLSSHGQGQTHTIVHLPLQATSSSSIPSQVLSTSQSPSKSGSNGGNFSNNNTGTFSNPLLHSHHAPTTVISIPASSIISSSAPLPPVASHSHLTITGPPPTIGNGNHQSVHSSAQVLPTVDNLNIAHSHPVPGAHQTLINIQHPPHTAHHGALPPLQSQSSFTAFHPQTVWQPVILPGSKNSLSNLAALSGMDLLDCGTAVTISGDSLTGHHGQQPPGSLNMIQLPPLTAAHSHQHSTSTSMAAHHHHHHNHNIISVPSTSSAALTSALGHSNVHGTIIHHSHASSIPISASTSAAAVTVPSFVPTTSQQQNEPMELSYKLESNNFQDMPMELTKVFQRDPLELCVRQDFGQAQSQPLMDLSSRVVNVTVGGGGGSGNSSMNPINTISGNIHGGGNSSNTGGGTGNHLNHYGGIAGSGPGSNPNTTVLTVPCHRTVDIVERELSLNDFTGAFRQPIDLISRNDEQSHELCSEGNLVDLSLRSSFVGQDQTASSFLRELIDLSSRSDTFHGEVNLTNKQSQPQPPPHSHPHPPPSTHGPHGHTPQLHLPHPSLAPGGHHPASKQLSSISNHHSHPSNHHHGNHHHNHHPHVQTHPHPSNNGGSVTLQNVIYPDAIFSLPN